MKNSLLLLIAIGCLWMAGAQHEYLADMRSTYDLTPVVELENAPPLMTFISIVLGGFRGLLADMLWLRVSFLQQEANFFELVQLSDLITKLEPSVGEVWAFHAWNLAYNVSVMMPRDQDRWRWIQNGISLLRDEGIRYNPADPQVYGELAWLYYHKIGGAYDDSHLYYKRMLSGEMQSLLTSAHVPHIRYEVLLSDPETVGRLRSSYKLLPNVMRKLDSMYGPLDWRLPEIHALYWAYRGTEFSTSKGVHRCENIMRLVLRDLHALQHETVHGPESKKKKALVK